MPVTDDAQILQVPLKAQGANSDDWASVRANDLTQLNAVLRQMQEQFFKLNGRTGDAAIRSGLSVAGGVSSGGVLSGTSLALGTTSLTPSNPSFAPTVESALTPVALDYAPLLGARADALAANPFTWCISDHFLGGGFTGLGDVGELGWSLSGNGTAVGLPGEANHPGLLQLNTNVNPITGLYLAQQLAQGDLSYMAWVVRPIDTFRTAFSVGFRDLTTPLKGSLGAYFSYAFAGGGAPRIWQTITRSAAGSLVNTSTAEVVDMEWSLLEIVLTGGAVDFFLNRERLFRHTGVSVDPTSIAYITCVQEMLPNDTIVDLDRCVVAGRGTDKIWS